jgi:hypothetical protein
MSSGGPGDFQSTLNELERRLRELMSDLVSPSAERTDEAPAPDPPGPPPMPPYRPPTQHAPAPPPAPGGGLQDQLEELLRFRDQLTEAAKALVEDYSRVLEQITRAIGDAPAPPAPPAPEPPPPAPPTTAAGHVTFPVPPPASQPTESTLYSGRVVVDAGPFEDIATVAAFEGALRRVPHAEDVFVRSFEAHRAVVELRLAAEVPLVFELRRASDQTFDVEHADAGRLTITMHSGNLPFPMRPANEHEAPPVPPPNGGETD